MIEKVSFHTASHHYAKMCGLTALLALKGSDGLIRNQYSSRELLARDIDSSLEIVKHRGPDAQGSWLGADCDVGEVAP